MQAYSRSRRTISGVITQAAAAFAAAIVLLFASGFVAPQANAANVPFWEQGDEARGGVVKRKYSKKYSKKSAYSSKKSRKGVAKRSYKGNRYASQGKSSRKAKSSSKKRAYSSYSPTKSLTGGSVRWVASAGCLSGTLKSVIYQVAAKYGPVTVSSTCRSKSRNRAVGGAKKSKHLSGQAADFRVHGNVSGVYAYLRSSGSVGGLKHYGGGLFHIDTGERRSW